MIVVVNQKIDISVIIPAYNRVDLLLESLRSVDPASRHAADLAVEFLIVDGDLQPPRQPYQTCQTIERPELEALFSKMISHVRDVCGADAVRGRFGI